MPLRLLPLVLAAATLIAAPPLAQAACSDPSGLCLEAVKGAKWEPGRTLTAKQRKAARKGAPGRLSLALDDGRGSVFVDGRFFGTAPISDLPLGPGKHDIQVRDGAKILAEGVLTMPKGANLRVEIHHP